MKNHDTSSSSIQASDPGSSTSDGSARQQGLPSPALHVATSSSPDYFGLGAPSGRFFDAMNDSTEELLQAARGPIPSPSVSAHVANDALVAVTHPHHHHHHHRHHHHSHHSHGVDPSVLSMLVKSTGENSTELANTKLLSDPRAGSILRSDTAASTGSQPGAHLGADLSDMHSHRPKPEPTGAALSILNSIVGHSGPAFPRGSPQSALLSSPISSMPSPTLPPLLTSDPMSLGHSPTQSTVIPGASSTMLFHSKLGHSKVTGSGDAHTSPNASSNSSASNSVQLQQFQSSSSSSTSGTDVHSSGSSSTILNKLQQQNSSYCPKVRGADGQGMRKRARMDSIDLDSKLKNKNSYSLMIPLRTPPSRAMSALHDVPGIDVFAAAGHQSEKLHMRYARQSRSGSTGSTRMTALGALTASRQDSADPEFVKPNIPGVTDNTVHSRHGHRSSSSSSSSKRSSRGKRKSDAGTMNSNDEKLDEMHQHSDEDLAHAEHRSSAAAAGGVSGDNDSVFPYIFSGNGSGSSCHQCKSRRTMDQLVFCCNMFNRRQKGKKRAASGREKRSDCRKKYCDQCLMKFYRETPPLKRQHPSSNWPCPSCRGICRCAACRRQKERQRSRDALTMSPATTIACQLVFNKDISKLQLGTSAASDRAFQNVVQSLNSHSVTIPQDAATTILSSSKGGDASTSASASSSISKSKSKSSVKGKGNNKASKSTGKPKGRPRSSPKTSRNANSPK
jgi:Zinc-finger domain of monoamine-oxidase A repressor R1